MKPFSRIVAAAILTLIPLGAAAQTNMVYRHELRAWVPQPPPVTGAPVKLSPEDQLRRLEDLARALRLSGNGKSLVSPAVVIEAQIAQLRKPAAASLRTSK